MKRAFYQVIWLLISITLLASFACQKWADTGEWQDDGIHYFCPDCQDGAYFDMVGTCARCGGGTPSISHKYCYDCAKEIDACQWCGKERWFWDIWNWPKSVLFLHPEH